MPEQHSWQTETRWKDGIALSATKNTLKLYGLMALLWNGFTIPIFLFVGVPELQKGNYWAALYSLFLLAGIWLAYVAIVSTMQLRRFGHLTISLDPLPGSLGGDVGGSIEIPLRSIPRQPIEVTLSCVHVRITNDGEGQSRHEKVVWRERGFATIEPGAQGIRAKFRFAVPKDLPQSDTVSDNYHQWVVHIQHKLSGANLDQTFEVPVFNSDTPLHARYIHDYSVAPVDGVINAKESIVQIDHTAQGLRLFYPCRRNLAIGFGILIFGLICCVSASFMGYYFYADFAIDDIFTFIFSSIGGIMIFVFAFVGVLAAAFGFYLLVNSLEVIISSNELIRTRRFMGIPFRCVVANDEFTQLNSKIESQQGQGAKSNVYYTLRLSRRAGKPIMIGDGIKGSILTKQLSKLIRETLNLS